MPMIYDNTVGGCCAIKAIGEFRYDEGAQFDIPFYTGEVLDKAVEEVNRYCEALRKQTKSMVFASLNTQQKSAQAVLEAAGFQPITEDWVYRDPKTTSYYLGVKAYMKVLCPEVTAESFPKPKS